MEGRVEYVRRKGLWVREDFGDIDCGEEDLKGVCMEVKKEEGSVRRGEKR